MTEASGLGAGHPAEIESRFASLEAASRSLSGDVNALNSTLQVVNQISIEQANQRERQVATDNQMKKNARATEERFRRSRYVSQMVGISLVIILALVASLVYWATLSHVNDLIEQQQRDRYASCMVRNVAAQENVRREEQLGEVEKTQEMRDVHLQSAERLRGSLVDCARYRGKS